MSGSKLLRVLGITFACGVSMVGLYSQSTFTADAPSAVSQDFLVLQSSAQESAIGSAVNVESLPEWQFTARDRPLKCRFVP
jgi:hypothetical protein